MAPSYISDILKLLLTFTVLLMFVISTVSRKQCTSKKTKRNGYVFRNIGIKLCQLKCAEHGQCVSIEYDIETLACSLLRDVSMIKKKEGHDILARSHSHAPTDSCTSGMCRFGQRCMKTRSGKDVCVQASTDPNPNTVPPAPVTTQDSDPHAAPSPRRGRELYYASSNGDLERVKQILAEGHVDVNYRGRGSMTPVMAAADNGRRDVLEFLVDRGADVSLLDRNGDNVLHLACEYGDLETVKLLLSETAVDVNTRNKKGQTAAYVARNWGHQRILDLLLSHCAD